MAQRNLLPRARRWHWRAPWLAVCLLAAARRWRTPPVSTSRCAASTSEVRDQRARVPEFRALPQRRCGAQRRYRRAAAQPRRARGAGGAAALRLLRAEGGLDRHRSGPRRLARGHQHHSRASRCSSSTSTCASTVRARAIRCSSASCSACRCTPAIASTTPPTRPSRADLQRTAATYGYLDAKLIRNELVVDPPNHKANIALELETGERYRFGATTIEQHVVRDSAGAPLPALPRGRSLRPDPGAAHAVRTR